MNIYISQSIDTEYSAHQKLSEIAFLLSDSKDEEIILDFSKVDFFASNQFAVLGCILGSYKLEHPSANIYISSLLPKLKKTIQKNGFYRHLGFEKLPDKFNTVIPYTIFDINNINSFEDYINFGIFNRKDIPKMSEKVKSSIIDNILEIFNNVKEHTHSTKVYTCGQYYPRSHLLYLTIVDSGETIPYNVQNYHEKARIKAPEKPLEWAMIQGNTTRVAETPGGLGLSLLQDFIDLNNGKLYIVSGKETYEKNSKGRRHKYMDYPFPGTIVTVAFNLSDTLEYHMVGEKLPEIIF